MMTDIEENTRLTTFETDSSQGSMPISEMQKKKAFHRLLVMYSFSFVVAISIYFTFFTAPKPVWFHLHPLIASLGIYSLCSYAVLLKKQGKTRQHSYMMFTGTGLAVLGVWIAYQDKSSRGKHHFASTHAQVGLLALCFLVPFPILSWLLLNPDNGWLVGNMTLRKIHRYFGQFILLLAFIAFGFGIAKYEKNQFLLVIELFMMGSISPFVLL